MKNPAIDAVLVHIDCLELLDNPYFLATVAAIKLTPSWCAFIFLGQSFNDYNNALEEQSEIDRQLHDFLSENSIEEECYEGGFPFAIIMFFNLYK